MKERTAAGRSLALLGASATLALGLVGCEHRNGDINRVQPGYVRKAIFQTDHEWHYRRTIAKSETTNSIIVEGHGDIPIDRIKWDIQENLLIAYKPYEAIPGSQAQNLEGNEYHRGPVLAAFPIVSHFDIIRGYDPLTGNETNVIQENTTDRVWSNRDYMRVNWSDNILATSGNLSFIYADLAGYWFPISWASTGGRWSNLETQPTDTYASRFSDDYVEVTHHAFLGMDLFMCAAFTGFSFAGYGQCGFGEAKIRHSFVRVNEPSDFIPRDYPDSVVRKDPATGQAIADAETGEVVREHYYNRFGAFRIEVPTYDRRYGTTESGRLFRAMVFNLWDRHTDEMGNEIPVAQRTPAPIIYYLNAEYPDRYRKVASEVSEDYNRIFTEMVASLQGKSVDEIRNATDGGMFQIKDNNCNEANIKSYVSQNPDYLFAVERAVCAEGETCMVTVDNMEQHIGVGNLKTVCTSLESATLDPNTGKSDFDWQRIGDARYNMVVWLNNPQQSGWGGYGPMHSDARTGETVSATSFLRGFSYEVGAATVVDYIELINDDKDVTEIIYGQDIRKQISKTLERRNALSRGTASAGFMQRLNSRMSELGDGRERLVEDKNPNHKLHRLERIQGTRLEEKLVNDMWLGMAGQGLWRPTDPVSDEQYYAASPAGRATVMNPFSSEMRQARTALGQSAFCFLKHEFDDDWAGLALALKDMTREERYQIVAERLIRHVMLHELGHNVSLAHNFEGTYDALNYDDKFWNLHWASEEEQTAGQYREFKHTTVMEYMSSKGAFGDFLGKYDEAAIRFIYGNQISVFDSASADENLQGGETLREWRYYNDYNKIPDHLCGAGGCGSDDERRDVIARRSWVDFDPQNPPANEVPFLFCDNYYNRMTPFCATFDYGADLKEIFANYYSMWSDYFFFRNFIRDRLVPLGWNPGSAMVPVQITMNYIDIVSQYFYYMSAVDPEFGRTDLAEDMAVTLANGLNMAAEVMSTPEPERMCPWPGTGTGPNNPLTYINGAFLNDCDEYADLNSPYAIQAQAIQMPLGDARPSTLDFTADYEDYSLSMIGSYFDKSNVMFMLGWSSPTLFRFNYDLDIRNYRLGLYRLFEPELRQFYDSLVNLDGFFLRQEVAINLGSYWCRDNDAPDVAHLGYFEPRKMLDPATDTSMPGPSANCLNPAVIYPTLLINMPFDAMFYAHALFSSDFDAQLDMGKSMKIFVVGAHDDFTDWAQLPNCDVGDGTTECYCEMTDQLTGLQYRAITSPGPDIPDIGCRVIELAQEAQDSYFQSNDDPFQKDNWREKIERLEFLRDLYRIFQQR